MRQEETFWMVYGEGQGRPTFIHPTWSNARAEARRLARENPGIRFVVLQAVEGHKVTDPFEVTEYIDVPF